MKRDKRIMHYLLLQARDQKSPPELAKYPENLKVYNAALLIEDGYVRGEALRGHDGKFITAVLEGLTSTGHDLLERMEAQATKRSSTESQEAQLNVFISHSSRDADLAEALINLLRAGIGLTEKDIRCSSVDGYRFKGGAETDAQLRLEVRSSRAFIGVITPFSIRSAYVLFELGARWGAKLHLCPLLARGADSEVLCGPLANLNALDAAKEGQMHQLLTEIADAIGKKTASASVYGKSLQKLVAAAGVVESVMLEDRTLSLARWSFESRQTTPEGQPPFFKRKIRVVLRNDTGKEIEVDTPDWATNAGDLAIQPSGHHLGAASKIRLENKQTGGWKQNKWLEEARRLFVPPAHHFEAWVGLNHQYTDETLERHVREGRIGTLVFFVSIEGQKKEVRIPVT